MKKQWQQILLAAGSAVGSMVVAALLRERLEQHDAEPASPAPAPERRAQEPTTNRNLAINFLSDLLAETYRKIRSQPDKRL